MTSSKSLTTVERIETVVVDPADIVEAFKRNQRDEPKRRSHVLRVSPPLESEVQAMLSISDDRLNSPPDGAAAPTDLAPEAFVHVRGDYDRNRTHISIPTWQESRSIARNDRGDDVDEKTVKEYHTTARDAWKQCVRTSLVDEVLLATDPESDSEVWADVRYDESSKSGG